MPPEPKKPIEELLEASARARRAEFGADAQMPNPMRAQLHDEIARLNRSAGAEPRRSWLAIFWPHISIATAMATVLVTGAVMWVKRERTSPNESLQLAMNAPARTEAAEVESGPSTSGRLTENSYAAKSEAPKESPVSEMEKFADVAIAAAPPTESLAKEGKDDGAQLASRIDKPAQDAISAPGAPAKTMAAAAAASGAAKTRQADAANVQQQFSQTARGQALRSNANTRRAGNILDTFQVEQNGRDIRLVDADGSTYTGKFEAPALGGERMFKQKDAQFAPAPASAEAAESKAATATQNQLFFRATGFNASLKKAVVFEGNYIAQLPPQKKVARAKSAETQQVPARIVGQAKVPGEPPVEVDAVSVVR